MRKEKLTTAPLNYIRIDDQFWNKYTGLVTKEIIPYQWKALNDQVEDAEPSYCISNFQIAAGLKKGSFKGWVFQDTDLAKWLEAVAYSLSYEKNEALEKLADEAIELVGKAQEENGYLDTYFSILEPGKQFCNLKEGHELYTAGHFMEAAVAYYKVTGKRKLLDIMQKNADLICEVFHTERYANAVPGHEEVELALVKMAEVTGEQKYLDMAKDFVDRRGTEPNYLYNESKQDYFVDVWHIQGEYEKCYGQAHLPVREQKTAEGHSVRATYLYCAMADIASAYQDETLLKACENLYENMTEKRMYITGGIGSSGAGERFTTDYDLQNESNYSESCASIGLALFCRRMAQITGEAKYIDTMERALVNTVLAGIAMDGKSFFYVNPLEVWPDNCLPGTSMGHVKPVRQKWFGCACCPPNIARTLASLGEYVYLEGKEGLWINMFTGSSYETQVQNMPAKITIESKFPWQGYAKIQIQTKEEVAGKKLFLRVPEYAVNYTVLVNGEKVECPVEKGYAILEQLWKNQIVEVLFDMPAHFVYANPKVRADAGKTCIVKGPLVYCMEQEDNGENLGAIFVDTTQQLVEEFAPDELGGITMVYAKGRRMKETSWEGNRLYGVKPVTFEDAELTFVPYCNWGNRKAGEMTVWMKQINF